MGVERILAVPRAVDCHATFAEHLQLDALGRVRVDGLPEVIGGDSDGTGAVDGVGHFFTPDFHCVRGSAACCL